MVLPVVVVVAEALLEAEEAVEEELEEARLDLVVRCNCETSRSSEYQAKSVQLQALAQKWSSSHTDMQESLSQRARSTC